MNTIPPCMMLHIPFVRDPGSGSQGSVKGGAPLYHCKYFMSKMFKLLISHNEFKENHASARQQRQ